MKKLLSMLALLAIPIMAAAQEKNEGMEFFESNFAELKAEAKKTGKPIFIDMYTTWCAPCKYLSQNIFPTQEAGEYMNANFVNAKFNAESGEGVDLSKKYKITGYPTLIIADAEGNEITRIVGSPRTPKEFVAKVKEVMEKAEKKK